VLVLLGPALEQDLLEQAARLMADSGLLAGLAHPEPNRAVAICLEDLGARLG